MRASTFGILGSIGLSLCVAAGDMGCAVKSTSQPMGGGSEAASPVKPIMDSVPATALTTQHYGIASWKVFMGRSQMVYEGYDGNGKPVSGAQVAWFKAANGASSHLRIMPLDGSGAAMRLYGATTSGSFSKAQQQFMLHIGYDFQQYMASQGVLTGASAKVGVQGVPGAGTAHQEMVMPHGVLAQAAPTRLVAGALPLSPSLGVHVEDTPGGLRAEGVPLHLVGVGGLPVREEWTWIGVGAYVAGGAAAVAGLAGAPATGTVLAVAAAGMGLYSYVTENPNTPPQAPVCQVSPTQSGDLQSTQTGETPSQQTFDQQWNQDMDSLNANQTCPSCSNPSQDLNVNPQNGDVQNGSDPNDPGGAQSQNGSQTNDQNDPGASGAQGTPTQGSSSGGAGGSSSGGGDGAQDQATQDQATQDQGTQDQATQDQGAQDQAAQDQAQDQASQDQGSQDASQDQGQDALHPLHHRRRHHRHHRHTPKTAWGRVYAFLASQPQP